MRTVESGDRDSPIHRRASVRKDTTWNGEVKGTVASLLKDARASLLRPINTVRSAARPETPASTLNRTQAARRLHSLPSLAHIPAIELSNHPIIPKHSPSPTRNNRPNSQPVVTSANPQLFSFQKPATSNPGSSRHPTKQDAEAALPMMSTEDALNTLQESIDSNWNAGPIISALQTLCTMSATDYLSTEALESFTLLMNHLLKLCVTQEEGDVNDAVTYITAIIVNLFCVEESMKSIMQNPENLVGLLCKVLDQCILSIERKEGTSKQNSLHVHTCAELLVTLRHLAISDVWVGLDSMLMTNLLERFCKVCCVLHLVEITSNFIPNFARALSALSMHSECVERFANDNSILQVCVFYKYSCSGDVKIP
jgi:hypothetical protein